MNTLNVQFSDATETTIVSYFGSPQDPVAWPNQGAVDASDERWKIYFDSQPPITQRLLPAPPVN
jgi:hypothetical protein